MPSNDSYANSVYDSMGQFAAEQAASRAATVYCAALNELYAALGVATQADALLTIEDFKQRRQKLLTFNSNDERW